MIRSPHKDKDSREHFEMRVHKRLIDIVDPNAEDHRLAAAHRAARRRRHRDQDPGLEHLSNPGCSCGEAVSSEAASSRLEAVSVVRLEGAECDDWAWLGWCGRDAEVGAITAFVHDVGTARPRRSSLPVRRGSARPCSGMSASTCRGRFGRVLRCHGAEAEATLSFAALSELLEPVIEARSMSSSRPGAGPSLRRCSSKSQRATARSHAVGLAVLDILRVLCASGPVVVAIDDAQWLDPASASAAAGGPGETPGGDRRIAPHSSGAIRAFPRFAARRVLS